MIACAPGIVFGALEARRSYRVAAEQEAVVRSDDAVRASVRVEDTLYNAREAASSLAARKEIRQGGPACDEAMTSAVQAQSRYYGFGRVDGKGRIICGSGDYDKGGDVSGADWFKALAGGESHSVSHLVISPLGPKPTIILASAVKDGATFKGAAFIAIEQNWFQSRLSIDLSPDPGAVVLYDQRGTLIASAEQGLDRASVLQAASATLNHGREPITTGGLIAERVERPGGALRVVAVTPKQKQTEIGLRSALIVLAPILVAALSAIVVWIALNRWVLRWFSSLQDTAHDFAAGRYAPTPMRGAPAEIGDLAAAFDDAVGEARVREQELAAALVANQGLTRELHHRVKNNLQVLTSLISRQQRRNDEPVVRGALSEARARMAPVALVYRFINPPEERTAIDMNAYLAELARQLHVSLSGEARNVKLKVEAEHGLVNVDDAANIGLIVAEAFVTGYANAVGMSMASAVLTWTLREDGTSRLTAGVVNSAVTGMERKLDRELVLEITRQLGAEANFEPNGLVELTLPARVASLETPAIPAP